MAYQPASRERGAEKMHGVSIHGLAGRGKSVAMLVSKITGLVQLKPENYCAQQDATESLISRPIVVSQGILKGGCYLSMDGLGGQVKWRKGKE